jgi:hypothetical protein
VRSTYSGWCDNEQWRTTLGYNVAYGSITNGLTVQFDDNGLSFSES